MRTSATAAVAVPNAALRAIMDIVDFMVVPPCMTHISHMRGKSVIKYHISAFKYASCNNFLRVQANIMAQKASFSAIFRNSMQTCIALTCLAIT